MYQTGLHIGGGSVKEWARWFYNGTTWRKCRRAYFISKHGLCERCPRTGAIVHHKIYLTPDNIHDADVSLSFDNLELLCQICHNQEHFKEHASVRGGFTFDSDGNLIRSDER